MSEPRAHVVAGVSFAVFLATLDAGIVSVALPTLATELGAPLSSVRWVALVYVLTVAAHLLTLARLGDLVGRRRIHWLGLAVFLAGSALCGASTTLPELVAARFVQGIGACAMTALGVAIVSDAVAPTSRGRALGGLGAAVALGLGLGPVLGGVLLTHLGWRAAFWMNLPLGVLALVVLRRWRLSPPPTASQPFDVAGAILLPLTITAGVLGLAEPPIVSRPLSVGIAIALMLLCVFFERRARAPLLDLGLFSQPSLAAPLACGALVFMLLAGTALAIPFFLEDTLALGSDRSGLVMAALPVATGVVSPAAGALADRLGARRVSLAGLLAIALACAELATVDSGASPLGVGLRLALLGAAVGLFQPANKTTVMAAVPVKHAGAGSAMLSLCRTLGQSLGLALLGAVGVASSGGRVADLGSLFGVGTALALGALGLGLLGTVLLARPEETR